MVVVEQLTAELKVELIAKLSDPLADMLRLHFQIFFVVKTDFTQTIILSSIKNKHYYYYKNKTRQKAKENMQKKRAAIESAGAGGRPLKSSRVISYSLAFPYPDIPQPASTAEFRTSTSLNSVR